MSSLVLALAIFIAVPSFAQAKHPFTFEDMMALKQVEEPVVSPDGKWVLFAAVDVDLKANTKTPHVWVVPLSSRTAGPSTSQNDSQANPSAALGMTESKEKEIISDQDADRPRWAPDGKRFAFVSTKEGGSQVWIADFDGETGTVTTKHRLTDIATEADGELWSPDRKNILFKSDVYPECDGTPQAEADCNAKKVEEKKNSKVKASIFTHLLYRHWNAYKEEKRTHLFVVPVDGCATAHVGPGALTRAGEPGSPVAAQGTAGRVGAPAPTRDEESSSACSIARDLTSGDYDAPVFSLGGQDDYAFSPDGQEICYASNHDPEPAISTNNDLFTVPVNFPADATSKDVLAATKNITADNKAADNTPLYSLDGKYIAYRAQARPGYESDRWRLMLYDRKTGEKRGLTEKFDRWVGTTAWAPDAKSLFFTSEQWGQSPIWTVELQNKEPDLRIHGFFDDLSFAPEGTLLFTRTSVQAPNEIFRAKEHILDEQCVVLDSERDCAQPEPLTQINDSVLSQISMSPLEPFWFTGAHGDQVQGWLMKPPNFDPNKKYPVKFIVHGGPEVPFGDEWSYRWNFELFAANGYVVVFINFHGSPGYGQKFIDAINGDWGGAPFEDLMKGLDYAEQHYPFIDKDRECALGASYGGYMANWILGHTNRFKCIVTHDGMFNTESAWGDTEELWFNEWEFKGTPYTNREMYRKWSPHLSATNFKTPTLVIHSQLDYRLDVSQGFDLFTTLQRQGVPSKMLYFPDEGHWVLKPQNSQLWYKTVNDWVDQWAKPVGSGQ
jgi:dipeptidyl aminopeptidase/acylaminoacyl peptidase